MLDKFYDHSDSAQKVTSKTTSTSQWTFQSLIFSA